MFNSLKKKLLAITIVGVLAFVVFVFLPRQQADAIGLPLPFGGTISALVFCPCSMNFLIGVYGPNPGFFVFQPGVSQAFAFGQVYRPGPSIIGTYTPGGVCLMYVVVGCAPVPSIGIINMVGTSL